MVPTLMPWWSFTCFFKNIVTNEFDAIFEVQENQIKVSHAAPFELGTLFLQYFGDNVLCTKTWVT